jgi:hypothetical protein
MFHRYELDILQYLLSYYYVLLNCIYYCILAYCCNHGLFYDSFRTLQYVIWYIFLFSSYVEQFLLLEPMGGMLCAVI